MKAFYSFLACCFLASALQAQQNNINIFTESGEEFFLFINSVQMNQQAHTNIKVLGMTGETYQLRVVFKDNTIPALTQNIWFHDRNTDDTYVVNRNRKGKLGIRGFGQAPLGQGPAGGFVVLYNNGQPTVHPSSQPVVVAPQPSQPVVVETQPVQPQPTVQPSVHIQVTEPGTVPHQQETVHMQVTTTVPGNPNPANPGFTFEVREGDEQVRMEMTVPGHTMPGHTGVTVTTSPGMLHGEPDDIDGGWHHDPTIGQPTPAPTPAPAAAPATVYCAYSMSDADVKNVHNSVKKQGFDDERLRIAQQAIRQTCMSSAQIKATMDLFGYDETRVKFASFAYDYCTDRHNYFMVNEAFKFSSSNADLEKLLQGR